ncbi:MAG: hypothetical protein L0H93_13470 [Nocardioides sp.]|nr:hypothetical protein [Nocardioides sp.]
MTVDFTSLSWKDRGALGAGVLATILSFFPAYISVSFSGGDALPGMSVSSGASAWHSFATLGILLVIAATALVGFKAFAKDQLPTGVPWNLVIAGVAALGTLLLILRPFTVGGGGFGASVGPGWSAWLLFLAAIALTTFATLQFTESGEKLPAMKLKKDPA